MELVRHLARHLDTVNRGREAGDEQLPLGVDENLFELRTNHALAGSVSGSLDVRGILQQGQHALLAVFGEGVEVKQFIIRRREIDLEIAGVDDHTQRRMHRDRDRADDGVGDLDGIDREWTELEAFTRHHFVQFGIVQQAAFFELVFHVGQGEFRGVDGHVQLGDQPGNAAYVVLVPMREQHAAHFFAVLNQVGKGGNDDVNAE